MKTDQVISRMELLGFTGELRGLESRISEAAPVVVDASDPRQANDASVATGLDWAVGTLRPLSVGDERYASFVRPRVSIAVGETVWIAGANYFRMLRSCGATAEEALRMGAWATLPGGYRWTKGTREAFDRFTSGIANKVTPALHRSLFDSLEKSHGEAAELFALLDASSMKPAAGVTLDKAIFYYETRDRQNQDWIRDQAVLVDKTFTSHDDFDDAFEARREWLRAKRFSESGFSRGSTAQFMPPVYLTHMVGNIAESQHFFEALANSDREDMFR